MKNNKHIRKWITAVVMVLFVGVTSVFAQVNKTAGTRITDVTTEKELSETALLDLDSSSKGFYMPRMNRAQRDELELKLTAEAAKGNVNTGLVIYNTTVDCIEYWHAVTGRWRSLCGSLPPAKFDLDGDCTDVEFDSNIAVTGVTAPSWQQGLTLTDKNIITLRVYVTQPGTYRAVVDSGNGYSFAGEGQFQNEGIYRIVLKGMGSPKSGYEQDPLKNPGVKGDTMKFIFNDVVSTKCTTSVINVKPAELKFSIDNMSTYVAKGKYFVGKGATFEDGNFIELDVTVGTIGTATVTASNDELGIEFLGQQEFKKDGPAKMILKPVVAKSRPLTNDKNSYDLTFKANVKADDLVNTINGAKATISIEMTEVGMVKAGVDQGKEPFYQGTVVNNKHIITVPVKVAGSGTATLKLTNAEGVEFIAEKQVFNMLAKPNEDTQNVVFTAVNNGKTMPLSATSTFTLSGTGVRFKLSDTGDKTVDIKVDKKPVAYTIDCAKITSSKATVTIGQPIKETYTIQVPVNVIQEVEYELKTTTPVQGITFSTTRKGVKAVFSGTGPQVATLYAIEENAAPAMKGPTTVGIVNNDGNSEKLCTASFTVRVGYPDLNILYIGNDYSGKDIFTMEQFFTSMNRFDETGDLVKTGKVNIKKITLKFSSGTYNSPDGIAERAKLITELTSGNHNLVVIEGGYTVHFGFDKAVSDAFESYITSKKGWVIATVNDLKNISSTTTSYFFDNWKGSISNLSYVDQKEQNAFANMMLKLSGNKDMAVKKEDRYKKLGGFVAPNTSRFSLVRRYPLNNQKSILWYSSPYVIDLTNSTWDALTYLDNNTDNTKAVSIIHKNYNLILLGPVDGGNNRYIMSTMYFDKFDYKKAPLIPYTRDGGETNGIKPQIAEYMHNLFITVIEDLMNK